jgi:hypothetical protein
MACSCWSGTIYVRATCRSGLPSIGVSGQWVITGVNIAVVVELTFIICVHKVFVFFTRQQKRRE